LAEVSQLYDVTLEASCQKQCDNTWYDVARNLHKSLQIRPTWFQNREVKCVDNYAGLFESVDAPDIVIVA